MGTIINNVTKLSSFSGRQLIKYHSGYKFKGLRLLNNKLRLLSNNNNGRVLNEDRKT